MAQYWCPAEKQLEVVTSCIYLYSFPIFNSFHLSAVFCFIRFNPNPITITLKEKHLLLVRDFKGSIHIADLRPRCAHFKESDFWKTRTSPPVVSSNTLVWNEKRRKIDVPHNSTHYVRLIMYPFLKKYRSPQMEVTASNPSSRLHCWSCGLGKGIGFSGCGPKPGPRPGSKPGSRPGPGGHLNLGCVVGTCVRMPEKWRSKIKQIIFKTWTLFMA